MGDAYIRRRGKRSMKDLFNNGLMNLAKTGGWTADGYTGYSPNTGASVGQTLHCSITRTAGGTIGTVKKVHVNEGQSLKIEYTFGTRANVSAKLGIADVKDAVQAWAEAGLNQTGTETEFQTIDDLPEGDWYITITGYSTATSGTFTINLDVKRVWLE